MSLAATVARQITRHGRSVTLRFAPASVGGTWTEVTVIGHLLGASDQPVVDGANIQQGDRTLRIAQASLDAAGVPRALRDGDQVEDGTETFSVLSVDRRMAGGAYAVVVAQLRGG